MEVCLIPHIAGYVNSMQDQKSLMAVCKTQAGDVQQIVKYTTERLRAAFLRIKQLKHRSKFKSAIFRKFMFRFPILKTNDSHVGSTGYVDSIQPSDISAPIMVGVDVYGRPFLTMYLQDRTQGRPFICTYFQRFSNAPSPWVCGGTRFANYQYASHRAYWVDRVSNTQIHDLLTGLSQLLDDEHPKYKVCTSFPQRPQNTSLSQGPVMSHKCRCVCSLKRLLACAWHFAFGIRWLLCSLCVWHFVLRVTCLLCRLPPTHPT